MAEIKTKQTKQSVEKFLNSVKDEAKRRDCFAVMELMKKITKEKPVLWGNGVIGFGKYHYKSERSRQEGDWFITGFSPRKQNLTLYIIAGFKRYPELMKSLGKYKTGSSCLYLNKLEDIDINVLKELIKESVKYMKEKF
jgi:hypothetical protein